MERGKMFRDHVKKGMGECNMFGSCYSKADNYTEMRHHCDDLESRMDTYLSTFPPDFLWQGVKAANQLSEGDVNQSFVSYKSTLQSPKDLSDRMLQ